jgi:hypothetical protein
MLNKIGPTVHYGDNALILRLNTKAPAHLHLNFIKGLNVAQKMALLAEDVTLEEKEALLALNEVLSLLMPSEEMLERSMAARQLLQ